MSLAFVSKTVQTSTSDGGFEEKPIASADGQDDSAPTKTFQKPLFEQLRDNQEEEDEAREEQQRSLMRGTLALDEEDAAHLGAVQKARMEKQSRVHNETQDALATFRAAQIDRMEQQVVGAEPEADSTEEVVEVVPVVAKPVLVAKLQAPRIIIKKRRRKQDGEGGSSAADTEKKAKVAEKEIKAASGGLGGLLTGYGSSSDED